MIFLYDLPQHELLNSLDFSMLLRLAFYITAKISGVFQWYSTVVWNNLFSGICSSLSYSDNIQLRDHEQSFNCRLIGSAYNTILLDFDLEFGRDWYCWKFEDCVLFIYFGKCFITFGFLFFLVGFSCLMETLSRDDLFAPELGSLWGYLRA